jgi:hypothetical protein
VAADEGFGAKQPKPTVRYQFLTLNYLKPKFSMRIPQNEHGMEYNLSAQRYEASDIIEYKIW